MFTVTPERLKEVVVEVLTGVGAAEDEAPLVADSLVRDAGIAPRLVEK